MTSLEPLLSTEKHLFRNWEGAHMHATMRSTHPSLESFPCATEPTTLSHSSRYPKVNLHNGTDGAGAITPAPRQAGCQKLAQARPHTRHGEESGPTRAPLLPPEMPVGTQRSTQTPCTAFFHINNRQSLKKNGWPASQPRMLEESIQNRNACARGPL